MQIARQRLVDLARKPARGVALSARDQVVECADDAVPVAEQVERHDRRDDEQRDDREDRLALGPQRRQHPCQIVHGFGHQSADEFTATGRAADKGLQPRMARIGCQRLQALHVARDVIDEGCKLVYQHRRDEDEHADEYDHEGAEHEQRGDQPIEPALGELVGQRIEQIGNRRPDHEGQENVMQQPEQADKDRESHDPERDVPLEPHGAILSAAFAFAVPARVAAGLRELQIHRISARPRTSSYDGATRRDRRRSRARSRWRPAR